MQSLIATHFLTDTQSLTFVDFFMAGDIVGSWIA